MAEEEVPEERSQREGRIRAEEMICSREGRIQGKLCTALAEEEEGGRSPGLEVETGSAGEAGRIAVDRIHHHTAGEEERRSRRHIHETGFLWQGQR